MEFFYGLIKFVKNNLIFLLICLLLIVINDAVILSDLYSLKNSKTSINGSFDSNKIEENGITKSFEIDLKGEVKKPGVYLVNDDMNVNDVIKMAGGVKKGASTDNINLSKKLKSEMVIIVSKKVKSSKSFNNETIKNDAQISNSDVVGVVKEDSNTSNNDAALININTASLDELQLLTGIGKAKAEAIIAYRKNNAFKIIEDILNVPGIGDTLFEKFKDQICV